MTLAKSSAAKLAVAFVAVAMALTLVAPAAHAQTEAELQAQIDQLLATIASLQSQVGGESTGSSSCSFTFTMAMGQGDTGAQVMNLQKFLNMDPETRVAASGAGSAGMETQYYGPATAAAVSKFQVKYRADVLTPSGLVNPTGYFGSASMAKANALCDGGMTGGDDDDDDTTSGDLEGGEASLEDFAGNDGDDTNLEEGQEEASVADFEFEVEDGDVEVNRIDVSFDADAGNSEDEPWEAFDEIMIMVDGDEVASMDASDEDEWSEDDPATGQHTLRFSGVDWVVRDGEAGEFSVAVSVAGSVDGAASTETWVVFIPEDGIRAEDSEGIQNYIGEEDNTSLAEEVSFDIDEEGGEDELEVSTSSEDPDATTLQLEDDDRSDWITVFAFDMEADSENDIEINEIPLTLTMAGGANYGTLINDVRLVIDGEEYDDVTVGSTSNATTSLTFDIDGDLVIESGEEVTAELQVEFKALVLANEGDTIAASITSAQVDAIDAEGADDLAAGQLNGSAVGETHTVRSAGVTSELVSVDSDAEDAIGTYTFEVDITAFESAMYISTSTGTAADDGFNWSVIGGTATTSATVQSDADIESGFYRIDEGQTETFTVVVTVDPAAAGSYYVILDDVEYDSDADQTEDATHEFTPESEYDSTAVSIAAS